MSPEPYLSIIIPAYNEAARIGAALASIKSYVAGQSYSAEVIIADDGSTDALAEIIAAAIADGMPYMRMLRSDVNRGKGDAVQRAMLCARGEYRLFMDADNSVSIDHVQSFLAVAQSGYDIAIGSIRLPGADVSEKNAWYRRLLGRLGKMLTSVIVKTDVYDTQRGFKLFSRRASEKIFPLQTIEGFGFDIEILVIARLYGFKVKEIPVTWINPSGSKVTLMSYLESLVDLMRIKRNELLGVYRHSKSA